MIKHCNLCNRDLDEEGFNWKNRKKGLRQYNCKKCTRKGVRAHYRKNRQYYIDKAVRRRIQLRNLIRKAKDVPCMDCGKRYPHYVMDFDHQENKEFLISRAINRGLAIKRLEKEIFKCEVVCSNCHRIRTHS